MYRKSRHSNIWMMTGGFTLVELMVVILIMGIILAFAVPSYNQYMIKAKRAEAIAAMMTIKQLHERYLSQHGTYCTDKANCEWLNGIKEDRDKYYRYNGYYFGIDGAVGAIPTNGHNDPRCGALIWHPTGRKEVLGTAKDDADKGLAECW